MHPCAPLRGLRKNAPATFPDRLVTYPGASVSPTLGLDPMFALLDRQLATVMLAAKDLPDEKRRTFLDRVDARLSLRGARISDADLDKAIRIALQGLMHTATVRP